MVLLFLLFGQEFGRGGLVSFVLGQEVGQTGICRVVVVVILLLSCWSNTYVTTSIILLRLPKERDRDPQGL